MHAHTESFTECLAATYDRLKLHDSHHLEGRQRASFPTNKGSVGGRYDLYSALARHSVRTVVLGQRLVRSLLAVGLNRWSAPQPKKAAQRGGGDTVRVVRQFVRLKRISLAQYILWSRIIKKQHGKKAS